MSGERERFIMLMAKIVCVPLVVRESKSHKGRVLNKTGCRKLAEGRAPIPIPREKV